MKKTYTFFRVTLVACVVLSGTKCGMAQRLLGIDVSAWQGNLSTTNWSTLHNTNDRDFVFIRASRGGTTGFDHTSDGVLTSSVNCNGVSTTTCLSRRYDDPYFGQNITRATNEGLFAGSYHFARPDVLSTTADSGGLANSAADEANHFMQMASAWMRPGYLPPVMDFEAGDGVRTDQEMAQYALDFSNRIYAVMQIRPAIYINGNYAANVLGGGTATQRAQLAQQSNTPPTVVSPAFPTLWSARWPNQSNPSAIDVQNSNPRDAGTGISYIYGPWDDYGIAQPWAFWQYASTARLSGYNNGNSNIDVDVTQGDVESVKDQLIPALWWNDTSGDWSTLANWNSGQSLHTYDTSKTFDQQPQAAPYIPPVFANMSPVQGSTTLPSPRLPGAAGSGPTAGSNDTVILERPNANITVTLSTGSHNIRKLYMREALDITGGSLTINYDPNYYSDTVTYPNALRSGPISAQFSGPVSLSGTGSLSVNTLQVDAGKTFTLAGSTGSLTFRQINLMPHASTPAKLAITGDVNLNPLNNATATITNGSGAGNTGYVDLAGGVRGLNLGNGTADVDLDVAVPVLNGGLVKTGAGTLRLSNNNTLGAVDINAGVLQFNGTNIAGPIAVNGGTLGGTGSVSGEVTVNSGGHLAPGASLESLGVGSLITNAGAVLDFELAAPGTADRVDVSGLLTLNGGSISLVDTGGLAIGTYNLLNYGTLSGSIHALGTPNGPSNFAYHLIDTGASINLQVSMLGDFNYDGNVDTADYAVWRMGLGTLFTQVDFDVWRAHFGQSAGSGAGVGASLSIPEPASYAMLFAVLFFSAGIRRH